ncbi:lymphocyte antigen 6G-like [Mugil cephalus]|uniref:lymphocyte antigen 6G-like n=1 Tax=Mugil cephalus TaxID=48193 RepID=UPI001FB7C442|nr:lymphocyte antigen 6G-like [Mugil cephalus]
MVTMKLYGALILFLTVSTAWGLRCYECAGSSSSSCTDVLTCPDGFDKCMSVEALGLVTKSCGRSDLCISPIKCCGTDLCNSAIPTGPSVIMLLVSSAIITIFL